MEKIIDIGRCVCANVFALAHFILGVFSFLIMFIIIKKVSISIPIILSIYSAYSFLSGFYYVRNTYRTYIKATRQLRKRKVINKRWQKMYHSLHCNECGIRLAEKLHRKNTRIMASH